MPANAPISHPVSGLSLLVVFIVFWECKPWADVVDPGRRIDEIGVVRRLVLLIPVLSSMLACAGSSKTCTEQAESAYHQCLTPYRDLENGDRGDPVRAE